MRQEDGMTVRKMLIVLAGALWLCLLGVIASVAVERLSVEHKRAVAHLGEAGDVSALVAAPGECPGRPPCEW